MTFFGEYRGHAHPHESPWQMTVPLMILAVLAAGGGVVLVHTLPEYLSSVVPVHGGHHEESIVESLMHSWVGFAGIGLALLLYVVTSGIPAKIYRTFLPIGKLFSGKYYFDEIYGAFLIKPLEDLARMLWKIVDQGIIDGLVNGVGSTVLVNGEVARQGQTGQIRHYALFMFIGTLALIVFYLVK
jgi:NADH-quinone oxidoreductase subunit L